MKTKSKKISFEVNKQKLRGTLIFPSKLKPKNSAILFLHGWTSNESGYIPRAKALAKLGFICLTFNLRGHQGSEGKLGDLSRKDHLNDTLKAFDFLASQEKVNKSKIGVVGSSYGGCLGSLLTSKRKVKWIVLRAPALYMDKTFTYPSKKLDFDKKKNEEYRKSKLEPKDNQVLKAISKFKGKVCIIQSEKDKAIPEQSIKNFINASRLSNLTHKIIKGASHSLKKPKWKKEFINLMVEWFEEKI